MEAKKHQMIVDLHVLLRQENKLLLMRRLNTGFQDGKLGLPSGHLEPNETAIFGAIRELQEELGVEVKSGDLKLVLFLHHRSNSDRAALFFMASNWSGDPKNMEPNKCSELVWCDIDSLPDDLIPYISYSIKEIQSCKSYSEYGWKDGIKSEANR